MALIVWLAEAVRWYKLAAAQEGARAYFNLGSLHSNGQGVCVGSKLVKGKIFTALDMKPPTDRNI